MVIIAQNNRKIKNYMLFISIKVKDNVTINKVKVQKDCVFLIITKLILTNNTVLFIIQLNTVYCSKNFEKRNSI